MAEVTRQIGPLAQQVNTLGNNLDRLYNSNGGPPGFLQTARTEDKGTFAMIFNTLDEFRASIRPLARFMDDHEARDKQKSDDMAKLEKRSNLRLAIVALVFSAISIISANMQGCKTAAHALLDPQTNRSSVQLGQDSKLPDLR